MCLAKLLQRTQPLTSIRDDHNPADVLILLVPSDSIPVPADSYA